MNRKTGRVILAMVFLGLLAMPWNAFGSGFALYEGSARGNALGGNLTGSADDASAVFYNPAGITQLEGVHLMAGATFINPSADISTINPYTGQETSTSSDSNWWVPPHLYATYQFNDKVWFGLGVFSRFGLGTEFDQDWAGRYNNYNAVIKTVSVNPNVALKLSDKWSIAAGVEAMYFDLKLEKKIDASGQNNPDFSLADVDSSLTGDTWGWGFNLGIHFKPVDWLAFGASYRSEMKVRLDGDADFTKPTSFPLPSYLFNDTGAQGSLVLPDEVFLGVAVWPVERLMLQAGAIWTRWSSFKELEIYFDQDPVPGSSSSVSEKDWHDTWRLTLGAEYKATDWLDLRVGYIYDQSPVPNSTIDYLVPANDRNMFSVGSGFHWRNFDLDLSYTYLIINDRNVQGRPEDGVYDGKITDGYANLIGVSVGYKF